MTPPPPSSTRLPSTTMAKCIVAYCANTRPCSAHDRPARPWARSRRRAQATAPHDPQRRQRVLDEHGRRCYICGRSYPASSLEVDHVIPLAEGGPDTPGNLRPACRRCHHRKTAAEAARARRGRP